MPKAPRPMKKRIARLEKLRGAEYSAELKRISQELNIRGGGGKTTCVRCNAPLAIPQIMGGCIRQFQHEKGIGFC